MTSTATRDAAPGHYRFADVARMEWIKLRSVRSTGWLTLSTVLAMITVGTAVGLGYRSFTPVASPEQIVNNGLAGAVLGQLMIGALGVLAATSEYASGIVRATYAAIPHRGLVLAAKVTTFGVPALVVGESASFASFFAGQIAVAGSPVAPASLADPSVLRAVVLTGAYLAFVGLLGLGLGSAIRHTGGAIGALFGLLFVPMFLVAAIGTAGVVFLKFVPMFILINSVAVVTPVPQTLSGWAGIAVLGGYTAAALLLGRWLLVRRDA